MIPINFIDANDQIVEADLEGQTFNIVLSWNEEGQFWSMDLKNIDHEEIVSGVGVVPMARLLRPVRRPEMPPGEMMLYLNAGTVLDRAAFSTGDAQLWYLTADEVRNAAV